MRGLKFNIYGKYAFFKNPESNKGTEFSFEHIHKPVVLGILGAILGLDGKGQLKEHNEKLEYYEKLKSVKMAIIPKNPMFNSHIEDTNNSTGFANAGDTQGITRKVLNDVEWTIILDKSSFEDEKLYDKLFDMLNRKVSTYPVSLGNRRYFANFSNVEEIKLNNVEVEDVYKLDSLYERSVIKEEDDNCYDDDERAYHLNMYFPMRVNELTLYEYEWVTFSNLLLQVNDTSCIREYGDKYYYFM